jgi:predicted CopG family antitoxin
MAVKTITIDVEAYALLAARKRAGESFSQVIKAHFTPQPTAKRFLDRVRALRAGADALDAMDALVRGRRREPARAVGR